jgi:hypothetical protein
LSAGGTYKYVAINGSETNALQNVVNLLAGAGAIPKSFSVNALFSASVSKRYNAILKVNHQVG